MSIKIGVLLQLHDWLMFYRSLYYMLEFISSGLTIYYALSSLHIVVEVSSFLLSLFSQEYFMYFSWLLVL